MSKNEYPRLCGGTFFTLVLQALRQRMNARSHYGGDSDGLSDPEVLVGLIRVMNPDYTDPGKENFKGAANNYKACKTSKGAHLPFDDEQAIAAFDFTIQSNYQTALNRMIEFVNTFLDLGEAVHRDTNLVCALIDLIQQDQSIDDDTVFYIGENGEKKKKATLGDLKQVCLPSFLLGIWHYIAVNRRDNSIGKETYDVWCPSNDGAPRKYVGNMGSGVPNELTTYMIELQEIVSEEVLEDTVEDESSGEAQQDVPPVSQQMVNNNPVFYNFNISGNNNNVFNHVDKVVIGGGGKQNE